jgi:hypothetical protein
MKTKTVGKRTAPKTPEEFHALGARLDRELESVGPRRERGFVFKARTWDELERWERNRLIARARRQRAPNE